jgi:hypothetical protein
MPLRAQDSAGVPSQLPETAEATTFPHRFWDGKNLLLFSGVAAARALDYTSTLNMRRRGRQEILLTNSVVDNHPLFAGIEVAGTGLSIGASYLFHETGHHRLERWVSVVHIGLAVTGDIRNYSLQTAHPAPASGLTFALRAPRGTY